MRPDWHETNTTNNEKYYPGMIEWGEDNKRRSRHDGVPGGAVELEGEDDVISAADLTDEATLGAQVAVENVVGGVLAQCHQVGCVFALRYLENKHTRIKDVSWLVQLHNPHSRLPVVDPWHCTDGSTPTSTFAVSSWQRIKRNV